MSTLYVVSTPIGNLEDITVRAIKTLFSVDYIACEDTRKTGLLLSQLKEKYTTLIYSNEVKRDKPKLISYYDEIESVRSLEIIDLLLKENNVALVSDSGTPLICDPGYKLIADCIKQGIKIVPVPGITSLITALTVSGLPPDKFLFIGYLPDTRNKRDNLLLDLQHRYASRHSEVVRKFHSTIIFFETPHRLKESLEALKNIFGDIEIVIARELTKIHEEIWRGKVSDALLHFSSPKGEFVILFPDEPS